MAEQGEKESKRHEIGLRAKTQNQPKNAWIDKNPNQGIYFILELPSAYMAWFVGHFKLKLIKVDVNYRSNLAH